MLGTDEVDDDYFTPVASASLANIFGKSSFSEDKTENESLKYTPPKPQAQSVSQEPDDSKATSCVFACALVGYEWNNNVYSQRGKLGFAMLKILKTGSHNIILYDSNKTTLSNVTVSNKLKVTMKSNHYISYYDDQTKYWSLCGTQNEINKITELLKSLDVIIKTTTETNDPPEPAKPDNKMMPLQTDDPKHIESDTDSSVNRKTKASILNRMAHMGHSVLPPNIIPTEKTSDSSDTNDIDHQIKAVRHKPPKGVLKRNSTDKTFADHHKILDVHSNVANHNYVSDQLVPMPNTSIMTGPSHSSNDMSLFITEQRINNSELRINLGRMSDKVDQIINRINHLEFKDQNEVTANVNTEVLHKLLREYENKIKVYEDMFQKLGTDLRTSNLSNILSINQEEKILKHQIKELEKSIEAKDKVILETQNEVETLRKSVKSNNDLFKKVADLEKELTLNKRLLNEANEKNDNNVVEAKIKTLMNETFQAVSTNFNDDENYSGESIKKVIAMVIKKVTINALKE